MATLSALCFSSAVGRWVDAHPSRLEALRSTIYLQRACVVLACIGWIAIVGEGLAQGGLFHNGGGGEEVGGGLLDEHILIKGGVMAAIMVLGVGERLSAVGNRLVMERDWVPTLVSETSTPPLVHVNAGMRRIDLACKLVAPVAVSLVALAAASVRATAAVLAVTNALSVAVEYRAAARVYAACPLLQAPKPAAAARTTTTTTLSGRSWHRWMGSLQRFRAADTCVPSLALALLYFSVVNLSASMTTFLLNAGFSLLLLTGARAASALVEVTATVVMPWGTQHMETRHRLALQHCLLPSQHMSSSSAAAVERMGLWGLWWQFLTLLPATLILFYIPTPSIPWLPLPPLPFITRAVILFGAMALSRLGLWVFDLAVQTMVQTHVSPQNRGEYSGVEVAVISAVELVQWSVTAVFSGAEEFRWVACAGTVVVGVALAAYLGWVWRRRGHLVHWEKVQCCR